MKKKSIINESTTAENLEVKFNTGADVLDYFDIEKAEIKNSEVKRVNLDIPSWAIQALDREATRRGVSRQSLMKMWLIDKLDQVTSLHVGEKERSDL